MNKANLHKRVVVLLVALTCMLSLTSCKVSEANKSESLTSSVQSQSVVSEAGNDVPEEAATDEVAGTEEQSQETSSDESQAPTIDDYTPYIEVNDNIATFDASELATESYESYSELDELGRCGVAEACVGTDIMPTEDRGEIGNVKPTGWQTIKYDIVSGKYLYNRCHLIGYQLTGENANEKNLITGTRYLNVEGMLPFEDMVADYVKETGNHVMYRVTPLFEGDNLVASGVYMMAYSVEDNGDGVQFNVYCPNIQPGIEIDYATGESKQVSDSVETSETTEGNEDVREQTENSLEYTTEYMESLTDEQRGTMDYIVNTETMKFHNPDCSSAASTKDENKETFNGPRQWLIDNGYEPCGRCKP